MFKNLRLAIFNWLGAGRLVIEKEKKLQEYTMGTTYTLGAGGAGGLIYNGGAGSFNYTTQPQPQVHNMNLIPSINFNVAKANGGWIVQVNQAQTTQQNVISLTGLGSSDSKPPELYLIAEDAEFDKELGKIISMACLKA